MKIIRKKIEAKKRGGCTYQTVYFYGFKDDNLYQLGLCADCFLDLVMLGKKVI